MAQNLTETFAKTVTRTMKQAKTLQGTIERTLKNSIENKVPPVPVIKAVDKVRNGFAKLNKTLVPPPVALLEMITGHWVAQALAVVAKLGVADHMENGAVSVEILAEKTGANPEALYRVMRALTVVDVFHELNARCFRLTPVGQCLRTNHPQSMRHVAMFQGQINWANWGELEHCVKTGEYAIEKVWGDKPFVHLAKNKDKAEVFDKAMSNFSALEVGPIIADYDFSQFQTIADVGGGYGYFLGAVLRSAPNAKGILFDLPHVIEGAKAYLDKNALSSRVSFETGSFFDKVPEGADAYVMKHIIHDWSDEEAVKIMKNIRENIEDGGKLLLCETVIPAANVPHFSKFLDLEMLVVTTGKERTEDEYRAIMAEAGFRLDRVIPTASLTCILEASPV